MDKLIQNFSIKSVTDFFKSKISSFSPNSENLDYIIEGNDFINFSNLQKVGEVAFNNSDELIVFTCKFNGLLSERSSKKRQFEIAKKVLKEDFKDGAIFIFYDENNCFRFSFIRKNYGNKEQKFTNWKRYTYFVDPSKTNKTFKNRINGCNFSSLEDIQEAFSVEKLNKKFYEEIATAFYSLIGGKVNINKKEQSFDACLKLPSTPLENRKVYQEFAVRLIGRTIFCWFLKNKKSDSGIPLIPEEWLSSNMVASVNNDQHNYYHAILEKLFFLVLNKKVEDRKSYVLPNKHELVPFLNGGLFEAQEDDFFAKDSKGIHQINFALNIPNDWFLKFFETLEQYNFTIDENSINDFEVSIDPEMLGTIFENLLAEIDPDTEKSARKSTGSFYTPREIVDYMVEQSLLQYIKTKTNIEDEEQLEILLKDDSENPFNNKQTVAILEALSEVKILDPACGSGAFPMGVLHKIIALLKKLDKGAVWWKAKQVEKAAKVLDSKYLNDFKEKIENSNSDYARKLGVIQHSIYGVDIQPIAAEISKLRSFLSLIIDENIDDKADNRGIEPLPNLEFKFVTANTLIGLDEGKKEGMMAFDFGETTDLQNQLQQLRNTYLQASPQEKENLKQQFEKLQTQIYKNELKAGGQNKRAQQLADWKPFSSKENGWFDPDWMFGVEKFDVVIGNPPYVSAVTMSRNKQTKDYFKSNYPLATGAYDLYILFLLKAIELTNKSGIYSWIIPNKFLIADYAKKTKTYLIENHGLIKSINVSNFGVFKGTSVYPIILFGNKIDKNNFNEFLLEKYTDLELRKFIEPKELKSFDSLKDFSIQINAGATGFQAQQLKGIISNTKTKSSIPFAVSGAVDRYYWSNNSIRYMGERYETAFINNDLNVVADSKWNFWNTPKIVIAGMTKVIEAVYVEEPLGLGVGIYGIFDFGKFNPHALTAILNSKFISFYFINKFKDKHLAGGYLAINKSTIEELPIVDIKMDVQNKLTNLSIKIHNEKKHNININTSDLENQIDLMVYKLYELSYAEVLVVDPEFGLSEEEYDAFTV